jgi:hypothetical protein
MKFGEFARSHRRTIVLCAACLFLATVSACVTSKNDASPGAGTPPGSSAARVPDSSATGPAARPPAQSAEPGVSSGNTGGNSEQADSANPASSDYGNEGASSGATSFGSDGSAANNQDRDASPNKHERDDSSGQTSVQKDRSFSANGAIGGFLGAIVGGHGFGSARMDRSLPNFPWPPPTPSEKTLLPRDRLTGLLGKKPSLEDVARLLTHALEAADYSEYSFYGVPGGFALVARMEQIEPDGRPKRHGKRFLDPDFQAPFSLPRYIRELFYAPQGFYRLIVFVVSDNSVVPTGSPPSADAAKNWLERGGTMLPPSYDAIGFTHNCQVTALIYEFRKVGTRTVNTLVPGRLDARTHLEKAGLYARLTGGGNQRRP